MVRDSCEKMYRFFVEREQIDMTGKTVIVTGEDRNHIKNVLRMKEGEEVSVMVPGDDSEYRCALRSYTDEEAVLTVLFVKESNVEPPCEVTLYQALPKADKMELIIQKAVELGVSRIVPVATSRAVVRLDEGKAAKKTARWNAISEAAAKQSKRAIIPEVTGVMTMREAVKDAGDGVKIIPYELADPGSMKDTRRIMEEIKPGEKVAVFIGPEGGFTDEEIGLAISEGFLPVTLGHRILRTETAGPVVLSWLIYCLEI